MTPKDLEANHFNPGIVSRIAQAQAAIDAINGNDFQGRPLRVNESQPKPREERGHGGFRRRDDRPARPRRDDGGDRW